MFRNRRPLLTMPSQEEVRLTHSKKLNELLNSVEDRGQLMRKMYTVEDSAAPYTNETNETVVQSPKVNDICVTKSLLLDDSTHKVTEEMSPNQAVEGGKHLKLLQDQLQLDEGEVAQHYGKLKGMHGLCSSK